MNIWGKGVISFNFYNSNLVKLETGQYRWCHTMTAYGIIQNAQIEDAARCTEVIPLFISLKYFINVIFISKGPSAF